MSESDRHGGSLLRSPRAMVARGVGIVCIALGFVLGIEGLNDPDSFWIRTSLGLIVTGLLAQAYALYCTIQHTKNIQEGAESKEGSNRDENNR